MRRRGEKFNLVCGYNKLEKYRNEHSIKKMQKLKILILITLCFYGCKSENNNAKLKFLTDDIPEDTPLEFKIGTHHEDQLIHKGIFSPDFSEYYYTISNKTFEQFDVYVLSKLNGKWSAPKKAFFNSAFNDHGMCFSPDGRVLYFSSTRPTHKDGVSNTWHIWKSEIKNGKWNEPSFVDIPNLRDKLVSHPTIANSGTLYFHASNLDYSEMDIYHSKQMDGKFQEAKLVPIEMDVQTGKCTPYISPDEDYLIYASIDNQLDLMVSFNDGDGNWKNTKLLSDLINENGQGNPYVTPDNKYLFFTSGNNSDQKWKINWVNIESELNAK